MSNRILVTLLLSALTALAGCGASVPSHSTSGHRQTTVEVRATEFRFVPDRIEVKRGTEVTVRLHNGGKERHEWELPGYSTEFRPIPPGASAEITFVADKPGTYEFLCDVEDHYEQGMRGFLTVR